MALPTTVYYVTDDTNTAAGTGGGSGQAASMDFVATTATNGATVATLFATIYQRSVRLVQKYGGAPPWTSYAPGLANIANTSVPSGTMGA